MKNKVVLDFCIWGFEDILPEYITKVVGIEPIKVFTKGQRKNPKSSVVAKENGWIMNAGLPEYALFVDR